MGLTLEVDVERAPKHTRFNLRGAGGDVLVQRRGDALDALQHIVNTAFRRELGDPHLAVDCLDFRKGKQEG